MKLEVLLKGWKAFRNCKTAIEYHHVAHNLGFKGYKVSGISQNWCENHDGMIWENDTICCEG